MTTNIKHYDSNAKLISRLQCMVIVV